MINKMIIEDVKTQRQASQLYINGDNISYFVSEHGLGKTIETIRQSITRNEVIVAPWGDEYASFGFKKFSKGGKTDSKITYLTLPQMKDLTIQETYTEEHPLRLCVDEGRILLEELLREKLGVPVQIDFMSLGIGDKYGTADN